MSQTAVDDRYFQTERVWKILLRIAPPVMLAQLIQALYNIVDSYFVGQYSNSGLTALSVIFPVQLIITAIAVGTGVGVNTYMARMYAFGKKRAADCTAGTGMVLAVISWAVFAAAALLLMEPYVRTSATSSGAVADAVLYGNIVCVGSLGIFLESIWTKVHQAGGNMRLPMLAQIAGALTNIVLDPILIFGLGPVPRMGIAGAAIATVVGQCVAAVITGISGFRRPPKPVVMRKYVRQIYRLGYPSIFMQMLYTVYIMALNMILAGFSDDAVTVLGLYYKLQSFFFIPLNGLQTCIVPILSYNFACLAYDRCKRILYDSCGISLVFMLVGVVSFECIPGRLIGLFSQDPAVLATGAIARTAANIKNGGNSPVAGMVHAVVVLVTLVFLMPLAALIPMPCIAAILLMVAYNMSGWRTFLQVVLRSPKSDAAVLLLTFFLTVIFDLVVAIGVGLSLACLLFMTRMANVAVIKEWKYVEDEDAQGRFRHVPEHVMVYEIDGPMFFGAADQIPHIDPRGTRRVMILRMRSVPALDITALNSLARLWKECQRHRVQLILSHVNEQPLSVMRKSGFYEAVGEEWFCPNIDTALELASKL